MQVGVDEDDLLDSNREVYQLDEEAADCLVVRAFRNLFMRWK